MRFIAPLGIVAVILAWVWLFVGGCEKRVCRVIGVYTHRVDTLSEYADYVGGTDLYRRHRAASLAFSCDVLRDQLTRILHDSMISEAPLHGAPPVLSEVVRLGLLGARRDGKSLHLMNDVTIGEEGLEAWAQRVRSDVQSESRGAGARGLPALMTRLFQSIVLHAGGREVQIVVAGKHKCN